MSINRRQFIVNGMSAATVALPFLESLQAQAQTADTPPPRVVILTLPHGQFQSEYFPANPTMIEGPDGMRYAALESISGPVSNVFTNRLDGYRSKINLIQGLDVLATNPSGGDHKQTHALCSSGPSRAGDQESPPVSGYSVDSILAKSATFYKGKPFAEALRAAYDTYGYNSFFSFNKVNGVVSKNSYIRQSTYAPDPGVNQQIFNKFFATTTTTTAPTTTDPLLARRTALNGILNFYTSLSKSTRLSSQDKIQLEQHTESFKKLASSFTAGASGGGSIPISGQCSKPVFATTSNSNQEYDQVFDLIVNILNCRMTQIVVLGVDDFKDPVTGVGSGQWHQESGHTENMSIYRNLQGWVADRVVSLIKKMDSVKESNGKSLLDNSVLLVLNQHAYENGHQPLGHVAFMAGSLGGKLKTGYYMDYRQKNGAQYDLGYNGLGNNRYGRPYNNLFITLFNALGIPTQEYERDGLVGFGEYNTGSKNQWSAYLTDAVKRSSLPFLIA